MSRPILVAAIALIVVVGVAGGYAAGQSLFSPSARTRPTPTSAAVATPQPTSTPGPTTPGQTPGPTDLQPTPSAPPPTPTPSPVELVPATVPLVPVVSFWSEFQGISREQLLDAIAGSWVRFPRVVVPTGASAPIAQALGIGPTGLIELDPDALQAAVADGDLGLLPLPLVTPAVRALALDGVALFGNARAAGLDQWPVNVTMDLPAFTWDQAQAWSLVAGGDIMLDRGTYEQVTELGKGVDFPWDGGTVSVTGYHCCTTHGYPEAETQRTGNAGVVRQLFSAADIAMANLEGPVKNDFTFHKHGFIFTGDPKLLQGIKRAGFDFLTLANNHIGNGGRTGIVDTVDGLDALGIGHAGAGTDLANAAAPAYLDAGGQKVAIIGCTVIAGTASDSRWGALRCSDPATLAAIAAARADADLVIVFAHWGNEYQATATRGQRKLAEEWINAGVDLIIGSHPHWAGAIDEIDGHMVFYTLGNLVFDQTWSAATRQGLILELTFQGNRVVQAWVHPIFSMSEMQPNLLDYDGGGSDVLAQVREASRLEW